MCAAAFLYGYMDTYPCNPIVFRLSECVNFNIHNNGRHKYERIGNILEVTNKKKFDSKETFYFYSFILFFLIKLMKKKIKI